jgi:hypothetical protein
VGIHRNNWRIIVNKAEITHDDIDALWSSHPDRLINRFQVAAMLDLNPGTLNNKDRAVSKLKFIKLGGACKYRVGDVREFVAEAAGE